MHCLEEGDWTDEDKCPSCEAKGHVSPWAVSQCPACNAEYFAKVNKQIDDLGIRSNTNNAIADLQSRVRKLEEEHRRLQDAIANVSERLISTGTERIGTL